MNKELHDMYKSALPFMLESHMYRSETWAAFMEWLNSGDRAAQDITGIIREYRLNDLARAWVAKRRELYGNNDARFQTDRAARLMGAPKNIQA